MTIEFKGHEKGNGVIEIKAIHPPHWLARLATHLRTCLVRFLIGSFIFSLGFLMGKLL